MDDRRSQARRVNRTWRTRALACFFAALAAGACGSEDPAETTSTSGGGGKGGERTCNAEGTAFGVCEGEVTPVMDKCDTPEDEDCDGKPAPACAGTHLASKIFGGTGDEQGRAIAIDATGAILVTGFTDGPK